MVMDTMQIRINEQLTKEIDKIVKTGFYANRADVIRDAVRRFVFDSQIGTIANTGNSVKEIKKIRNNLSKQIKSFSDVEKINNF
jgi:Arc/MetJ-type ribon-helix-helix transcriptional regulator